MDEVAACFLAGWTANTPVLNGGIVPPIDWPDVPVLQTHLDAGNAPWARFNMRHTRGAQTSLGGPAGSKYTRSGVIIVQVFTPVGKQGLVVGLALGKVIRNAFEAKQSTGYVYLRHVAVKEVGRSGPWMQVNVSADFVYYVNQ